MRLPKRLEVMDPGEVRTWTHDFAGDLSTGETVTTILGVNVTVHRALPGAVHATPNDIKSGAAALSGSPQTKLLQGIANPVHGIDYELKAEVRTSTNREIVGVAILPVRTL
jgi:hypothetical protein